MCTRQLALLQAFFLMFPQGGRPQPSSFPSEAVPTPSVPATGTPGETVQSSSVGTAASPAGPEISVTSSSLATPSAPGNKTVDLFPVLPICICDLTAGTCDVNCCCDRDCYLLHPMTVFSFCLPGSVRSSNWVCIDNSLIFRSNSPFPSRVVLDSNGIRQFCVHVNNTKLNYFQKLQKVNASNFEALAAEFGGDSFASTAPTQALLPFYKAGDPVLTYFPKWSAVSLLRQPAGVGAGGLCAESNPAGFLESRSTTCTRFFKNLASSCTFDPALDAASYYNFTVLRVPRGMTDLQNMKFQVPVTLASQADPPFLAGNACQNVVSQVIYEIETNGTFGIQRVTVSFGQTNLTVEPGASLQQHFIIRFKAVNCTSCCTIPVALEIQVLWAYVGLLSNPQAHVSRARFLYQCQTIQDAQQIMEVSLTTLVNFVDITQKPEPPRGQPRVDWKLPFDFFFPFKVAFSRGVNLQKGSGPLSLILCLLLLGVLNLETK
ncbi:tectonic-3 isoform X2 [Ochotona princeps]|uniref:tectonic-3 isoform X2 n=1 Tax=Ochotona princeps TaxID=9978 RepID=UPI002714F394|nr:tectonic-3 isoform X2 [Ochotona princeps]